MPNAFSAPGKALLVGGYLVLDPKYKAYAVALSARIHCIIESSPSIDNNSTIVCSSPQFLDAEWIYTYHNDNVMITEVTTDSKNPFLHASIKVALAYTRKKSDNLHYKLTIFSDNAFHTQKDNLKMSKNFSFHTSSINKVPKTGLGSSAALTVAVMTALLSKFDEKNFNINNTDYVTIIHNLAQVAHCFAQGKIGSGFDIATAVWGSIVYSRFPPEHLKEQLDLLSAESIDAGTYEMLCQSIRYAASNLSVIHEPCSLPSHVSLLMGDINGGSETPKMVNRVLKWHKENPTASNCLFESIYEQNERLVDLLGRKRSDYGELSQVFSRIRQHLRALTKQADVPIEPPTQTFLLDTCMGLNGVIGGVVPGAGGYDAICLLVQTNQIQQIKTISATDKMLSTISWLDLHEESVGLQRESLDKYPGFP